MTCFSLRFTCTSTKDIVTFIWRNISSGECDEFFVWWRKFRPTKVSPDKVSPDKVCESIVPNLENSNAGDFWLFVCTKTSSKSATNRYENFEGRESGLILYMTEKYKFSTIIEQKFQCLSNTFLQNTVKISKYNCSCTFMHIYCHYIKHLSMLVSF